MNMLAVNYEYTTTGSTLALLRLAEHLRRSGHQVSICAVQPAPGPISEAYRRRGFALLDWPAAGSYDLAICNTLMTAPQVLALAGATKTIWWIHEGSVGIDILLRNPHFVAAFAAAHVVLFPIAHLRDTVYRSFLFHLDSRRFVVAAHGIPPVEPPPPAPGGGPGLRIVSIGSIYPRKRHGDLIKAVAQLQRPAVECILVGRFFALPQDCVGLLSAYPERYRLAGELEPQATQAVLRTADIFALPSASEVLPLATLEAAMLTKAMVLSDLPAYAGLWRHGYNCLLHPVGDVDLLAHSLELLAANPPLRARLGAAARRTATPYSETAFFARFDSILAGL